MDEAKKALYKAIGGDDTGYVLDLEADPDEEDLEKARLKQHIEAEHRKKAEKERDALKKELKALQDAADDEANNANRKKGDIEALEKSWKTKFETREAELQAQVDQGKKAIHSLVVESTAREIAGRISNAPDLLAPVIAARLSVEYQDDKPVTRVLDVTGQPSASSLSDLEKEIVGDKRYAPVIIAGKGSGGGSHGSQPAGGQKKLSEMSEQERIDWYKRDPDGFRKASADQS